MSAEAGGMTATRCISALLHCASSLQSRSAFCPASEPSYATRMRLYMVPPLGLSVDCDFEGSVPDAATAHFQFKPAAPLDHQRHEFLVDIAPRPRREDRGPVVEPLPPAVQVPDLHHRLRRRREAHA